MESNIDEICCPYCPALIPATSTVCVVCGHQLQPGSYAIVPDGSLFAIVFEGKVKIHSLTREKAEMILAVVNKYLV